MLALIFVACNTSNEPNLETPTESTELNIEIAAETIEPVEPVEPVEPEEPPETPTLSNIEIATANWLTEEDFSYDIEILIQNIEESFPFIGVAERLSGNTNVLDDLRDSVSHLLEYQTRDTFLGRVHFAFYNIFSGSIAHLDINPRFVFSMSNSAVAENTQAPSNSPPIIEEGRIALIRVPQQLFDTHILERVSPRIMRELQEFIAEIQGYEHVILDIRHIGGGWIDNFITVFIAPNISERLSFQEFAFITDGELAQNVYKEALDASSRVSRVFGRAIVLRRLVNQPAVPAAEFAEQNNLTNMNEDDLANLAYGFMLETIIIPSSGGAFRTPLQADNIWLLMGQNNLSGSEWVARLGEKAGFTLVGEQASGRRIGGAGRAVFQLPNTRHFISMDTFYITDNTGRAMEEFPMEPHYFNRPGMDALQTTLAIIAERAEQQE